MDVMIRSEKGNDFSEIKIINDLAFKQTNEGLMVEKIRKNKEYIPELSLVAIVDKKIVGHILFFPVKIINDSKINICLSLAPVAVHPDFQNRGIGSKLVKEGLKKSLEMRYSSVIVVGHPNYYPRFGFKPASLWNIRLAIEVPDEVFMAVELTNDSLKDCSGIVEFPKEYREAM